MNPPALDAMAVVALLLAVKLIVVHPKADFLFGNI
jgi:hypothetical protein